MDFFFVEPTPPKLPPEHAEAPDNAPRRPVLEMIATSVPGGQARFLAYCSTDPAGNKFCRPIASMS